MKIKLLLTIWMLGFSLSVSANTTCADLFNSKMLLPAERDQLRRDAHGIFTNERYGLYSFQKLYIELALGLSLDSAMAATHFAPYMPVRMMINELFPQALNTAQKREVLKYYGPTQRDRFFYALAAGMDVGQASYKTDYYPFPNERYLARAYTGEALEQRGDRIRYLPYPEERAFAALVGIGLREATLLYAYLNAEVMPRH